MGVAPDHRRVRTIRDIKGKGKPKCWSGKKEKEKNALAPLYQCEIPY
jgi:hypothetical protein